MRPVLCLPMNVPHLELTRVQIDTSLAGPAPRDALIESAVNSTYSMAENAMDLLKEGETNLEELMRTLPYATICKMRSLGATTPAGPAPAASPPLQPRCGW